MKKKILVVDDEKEIVDFLDKFISRFNLCVIKTTKGNEAISLYNAHTPEFVFLDIKMPDKDGLTILKELRQINPKLRVIMITAKAEKEFRQTAKKYGALDYITKPLDLAELFKKIHRYIIK